MVEQKAFRGKLWAAFGMEQLARNMWERFTINMAWPDQFWQMQKRKGKTE